MFLSELFSDVILMKNDKPQKNQSTQDDFGLRKDKQAGPVNGDIVQSNLN